MSNKTRFRVLSVLIGNKIIFSLIAVIITTIAYLRTTIALKFTPCWWINSGFNQWVSKNYILTKYLKRGLKSKRKQTGFAKIHVCHYIALCKTSQFSILHLIGFKMLQHKFQARTRVSLLIILCVHASSYVFVCLLIFT